MQKNCVNTVNSCISLRNNIVYILSGQEGNGPKDERDFSSEVTYDLGFGLSIFNYHDALTFFLFGDRSDRY